MNEACVFLGCPTPLLLKMPVILISFMACTGTDSKQQNKLG